MCLAKAYLRSTGADAEDELLMENVTRAETDGEHVHLASLLGDRRQVKARITSVDFADSRIVLETTT